MRSKNILITGADGQLGKALLANPPTCFQAIAANRQTLDITDQKAVIQAFDNLELSGVINAAAYTAVDKAESEPEKAIAVNTKGVANLGIAAREFDIPIVHASTDFVFDGEKASPYLPNDEVNPKSVYGKSKAEGENALLNIENLRCTIIRTAWVYNAEDANFVTTMLRLMREKDSIGVVADQVGTPTRTTGLASACWLFLKQEEAGVFHWTDAGVASWYDFAVSIQNIALEYGLLARQIPIKPIRTSDYPTPAVRPKYSVLDKTTSWDKLEAAPQHWYAELRSALTSKLNGHQ